MSLPWLSSNFKRSTKSRSRSSSSDSEKKKTRIDEFGRTVPVKSRSRSKSRSRKRSRSRSRDRQRSSRERGRRHIGRGRGFDRPSRGFGTKGPVRREEKGAKRRRNRSGSQSSDSNSSFDRETSRPAVRPVASNELKYTCARLFVANVSYKEMNKSDLVKHFEKYGQVLDLLLHPKNYAFVQYSKEEDARLALEGENGSTFQGYRLEVKMAQDGKRDSNSIRGGRGRGRGAAPHDKGWGPGRDDPFIDGPGGPRMPHPPIPGEFGMRDPYFPPLDPYRSYPDPWYPGPSDPYGPAPFADPYLDPFAARAPPPPPPPPLQPATPPAKVECQIYLVSPKLRAYGEDIEQRVKEHCIITGLAVMPEGHTATQMLEELTDRDGLFAVFVNTQNEAHRSLTLNILHGTPQEHRNMPMNDAIELIGRSFEEYVDTLREKAKAASAASSAIDDTPKPDTFTSASRVFLPASSEVAYLLNLLADNRALTISELGDVIQYLKDRRDKLIDAERRPLATDASATTFSKPQPQTSNVPNADDLTEKILNLISSTSGGLQGLISSVNVNNAIQQQQQQQAHDQQKQQSFQPAPPPPPPPPPHQTSTPNTVMSSGKSTMINFDNPNVQKALDNLIQSSPVLRQTFTSTVSPASTEPPAPSIDSVSQMVGRSSMKGYGQAVGPDALVGGGGAGPESYGMFRMQRPPQPMGATSNTVGLTRPQTYNQEPF
ncbi:nuclear receptor coactivator 5 [Plakobranchus ocellatus]|uniref:Nuclear receptor coactivator 5 n=1 Tax=Plakobranchus ocellatus TaxID=259542 RepID=A0AAV3Y6S3_9GAST|nr:nuclear receptor coactivator 5 [Plakobranchus ocellatus]